MLIATANEQLAACGILTPTMLSLEMDPPGLLTCTMLSLEMDPLGYLHVQCSVWRWILWGTYMYNAELGDGPSGVLTCTMLSLEMDPLGYPSVVRVPTTI